MQVSAEISFRDFYNHILKTNIQADHNLPYPVYRRQFKKGVVITGYNQVEEAVYFIRSGIAEMTIRSYTSEKIIDFFFEREMCTSLTSFLTQQPSDVQLKTLTVCDVDYIRHSDLQAAYIDSLDANRLGRILTEQAYLKKAKREKDFLSKTAEERYQEMFKTHTHYISQVPVNKIARYLGIHPESLSRIRHKVNS